MYLNLMYFLGVLLCASISINAADNNHRDLPLKINRLTRVGMQSGREVVYHQKILGDLEDTKQYEELSLYQAPVVHPYDATGEDEAKWRTHYGVATYLVFAKMKWTHVDIHAPSLKKITSLIEEDKHVGDSLHQDPDVFVVVQNAPWVGEKLLLRPHYWIFGQQPNIAKSNIYKDRQIQAKIISPDHQMILDKQTESDLINDTIAIHAMEPRYKKIISSADNLEIHGIPQDRSCWFWSFVRDKGNALWGGDNRCALTLHVILADNDFDQFSSQSNDIQTIEKVIENLQAVDGVKF